MMTEMSITEVDVTTRSIVALSTAVAAVLGIVIATIKIVGHVYMKRSGQADANCCKWSDRDSQIVAEIHAAHRDTLGVQKETAGQLRRVGTLMEQLVASARANQEIARDRHAMLNQHLEGLARRTDGH